MRNGGPLVVSLRRKFVRDWLPSILVMCFRLQGPVYSTSRLMLCTVSGQALMGRIRQQERQVPVNLLLW